MVILYVETNFLMGIAKGQDSQAENFLQNTPILVRLTMPSICYVEALTTLEQEDKYSLDFIRRLDIQINEAERDKTSQNAKLLRSLLDQSKVSFVERTNDIKERFYIAFNQLSSQAEIITLNPAMFQESLERNILQKHLIDKLILECIIHHARLHFSETKVFLSSNSKEFGKREVVEILQNTGIQYFNKTQNFLGWLQSQLL
ncbi:PIN domain-containing protein [Plectonema radiosum NIES-515]|uniref:PIN domain-containing protein n=1 Tax=Plectonema radiosum NIES-515 TaxID=2986073 RepID=A0ABT3AZ15_9CYAN|nr:PIN domain-containing protein [Plectonema radiosum]MCV3214368.1 PIN domain-containing protein [Plectonema radiosum NIES-515]